MPRNKRPDLYGKGKRPRKVELLGDVAEAAKWVGYGAKILWHKTVKAGKWVSKPLDGTTVTAMRVAGLDTIRVEAEGLGKVVFFTRLYQTTGTAEFYMYNAVANKLTQVGTASTAASIFGATYDQYLTWISAYEGYFTQLGGGVLNTDNVQKAARYTLLPVTQQQVDFINLAAPDQIPQINPDFLDGILWHYFHVDFDPWAYVYWEDHSTGDEGFGRYDISSDIQNITKLDIAYTSGGYGMSGWEQTESGIIKYTSSYCTQAKDGSSPVNRAIYSKECDTSGVPTATGSVVFSWSDTASAEYPVTAFLNDSGTGYAAGFIMTEWRTSSPHVSDYRLYIGERDPTGPYTDGMESVSLVATFVPEDYGLGSAPTVADQWRISEFWIVRKNLYAFFCYDIYGSRDSAFVTWSPTNGFNVVHNIGAMSSFFGGVSYFKEYAIYDMYNGSNQTVEHKLVNMVTGQVKDIMSATAVDQNGDPVTLMPNAKWQSITYKDYR